MMKEKSTVAAQNVEVMQFQAQDRKSTVWTREKINQLIELYKKHECLWNHWHEAYKNKDKRNRAIEDICTKLNIPKFEFGKKIHNLRNQFNMEMKKLEQRIEEAGVSIDDTNDTELRCKWSHFESLMFLRHVIEPRPGGYQTILYPPKKMRLKFDLKSSDDDISVTKVFPSSSSNVNTEDLSQFPYDDNVNEEVITDDFQSFENEIVEVDQRKCSEEVCDQKYQPPQQELCAVSSHSCKKISKNQKHLHIPQNSPACSLHTDININENPAAIELNSNNISVVSQQSHIPTSSSTSSPATDPVISSVTSTNSSNRPASITHDQWDAFGELVANEFRNLNFEISRKRLKRKIMQAMLEIVYFRVRKLKIIVSTSKKF